MRIAWVSSWPPRPCGIATYSSELVGALRGIGNEVKIVCHTDGGCPGEKDVYPVLDTDKVGWDEKLYSTVEDLDPEVVHIQHEYGLYRTFNDHAAGLLRPLFRWKVEERFPVVMTYHSVYTTLRPMEARYMDLSLKLVDAGIVHALYQWVHLPLNIGRTVDNAYVIPHGTKENISIPKQDAKNSLGLGGKKVVGMLGWFTPTKGFDRVIRLWDIISAELGRDAILALAGDARRGDPPQKKYKEELLSLVERSPFKDRVKVILGSFSPEEYNRILASFDLMVMPYSFASQSGNLAHSLGLGVPVVAFALEGLKAEIEGSGAGMLAPPGDDEELGRAIVTLIQDDSIREKYSERAVVYVKERIGWSIVARKHIQLYEMLQATGQAEEPDLVSRVTLESQGSRSEKKSC